MAERRPGLHLMIVDDDRAFREALAAAFTRRGYEVRTAGNANEAMALCEEFVPDRAVIDQRMPGPSGLELLRSLRERLPDVAIVVLTGYGSIANAVDAVKAGAVNYLTKPAEPAEIEAAFTSTLVSRDDGTDETPSLDRAQWEHLQRVLAECGGNISEAARRLKLHRRTLQRMLQKQPFPR